MAHGSVNQRYWLGILEDGLTAPLTKEQFDRCLPAYPDQPVGVYIHNSPTGVRTYVTLYLCGLDLTKQGYERSKGRTFVKDESTTKEFDF